jgi:hypothetical protein
MATKEQQIANLEDKLRRLKAQKKQLDRRDETRRKILYGAAFLALAESAEIEKRRNMLNRVEQHITRPTDRDFLGLPHLPTSGDAPAGAPNDPIMQSLPFGTKPPGR